MIYDGSVVSIQGPDRRKHMAIFGKSGVGKITLMRNMIVLSCTPATSSLSSTPTAP